MGDVATLIRRAIHGILLLVAGTTLGLAAPGPARATTWGSVFEPAAIGALAIPGRTRVTLVAAGEPSPALDQARSALAAAIKASGKWTLLDAHPELELEPDLEDAEVLELERDARDVEAVWILRLLPGASTGAPATAVVKLYAPLGAVLGAFSVTEGQRMLMVASAPDLASEYLRQRISPVASDRIVTTPGREVFTRDGGFAKDGARLREPRDLYIAMGRYDLMREYDSVSDDRRKATIISGSVIFVGAVLFMQDVFDAGGVPTLQIGALGISGIVAGGLGTIGLVLARTIDPDPLDWNGKVEAATAYNANLKKRLDLPVEGGREPGLRGARVTGLSVSPLGDGLALTLGGAF